MQRELRDVWRSMRFNEDVRVRRAHRRGRQGVLHRHRPHGADGRRTAPRPPTPTSSARTAARRSTSTTPATTSGPKSCDLWKPVIAAVNGMACGGAFYMLGEVEFIIAAEHATFFDPHVTYGMTASFEPIHMAGITPFCEIMRISLMGNYERLTATARVRDRHGVGGRPRRPAARRRRVVRRPRSPRSPSSRSRARCGRSGAHASSAAATRSRLGYAYVEHGHEPGLDRRGPEALRVGHADRVEGPLSSSPGTAVAIVGAALSDCGRVDDKTVFELHYQAASRAHRRRRPDQGRHRRLRLVRHRDASRRSRSRSTAACAPTGSTAPASAAAAWEFMVEHAAAAIQAGHVETVVLAYGSTTRADLKTQAADRRTSRSRAQRAVPVRRAVRAHADLEVRDGDPPAHDRVRHHDRAARRDRGERAVQRRRSTPRRTTATRSRSRTCRTAAMIADPFTKLHCCIRSDGGGAVVLTSEERARDLAKTPILVLGTGEAVSHTTMSEWPDVTESPAYRVGRARVRACRRDPGRHRLLPVLRRVHRQRGAHARGARLLREGRGRRRSSRTASCGSAARCPPTPTAAGSPPATPGCAGCSCSSRRSASSGGEAEGRQVPDAELCCVNGTGGWFSSASTVILGTH